MRTNVAQIFAGRKESELLAFPSVRRMADILVERCREQSWVRTSVASLERFRAMTGQPDLEMLLERARTEPVVAEQALASFALALTGFAESQVSELAMGPKIWFRLNGVNVPWRPLPGRLSSPPLSARDQQGMERAILLGLIGSGLRLAELLRLRVGDAGSLDSEGHVIPDLEADPLAVQYTSRRGKQGERITFFTSVARQALLGLLAENTSAGQPLDADAPLFTVHVGTGRAAPVWHEPGGGARL